MKTSITYHRRRGFPWALPLLAVIVLTLSGCGSSPERTQEGEQEGESIPQLEVVASWPKPLPSVKDQEGIPRQWVTGMVGASCVDSHDHIFTANRAFQEGGLTRQDGDLSIAAPPIVAYDPEGNIVGSWGDPTILPDGRTPVLPRGSHGCFVDYEDNLWLAGNRDGVVQKWSHDGEHMLLQIGTKGVCDGPPTLNPEPSIAYPHPTCGSPGSNSSQTLLNNPADIAVDPGPDPITGESGSVYIADGYGNHRVVVFDRQGKYLRQWGSAGSDPGQFTAASGTGHPHCVVLGKDGLVYVCDRGQNRIQVFDKLGNLERIIPIDPPDQSRARERAADLAFSPDGDFMYVTDLGSARVWILDVKQGSIIGEIGRAGHMAGEFNFPHTLAVDSKGNLYVAESSNGRRIQKFRRVR